MKILVTGATGFLGEYLVALLAKRYEKVFILSRKAKLESDSKFSQHTNVFPVTGDITHFDVINSKDERKNEILDEVEIVIHAAALYDLEASYSDCFLHNVVGTQNILHVLKNMKNLKAFFAISTIAVGDPNSYFLDEDVLPQRSHFTDSYSATKYQAEKLIRENVSSKFITRIIRPGIIIGDTNGNAMPKLDGPYYFIRSIKEHLSLLSKIPIIPLSYNSKTKMPIIPVDHCARLIELLIHRAGESHFSGPTLKTYHLISHELPTIKMFLDDLCNHFGLKTTFIPLKQNIAHDYILKHLGIPKEVLPFMFSKLSYDKSNTLEDLPEITESTYGQYKSILFGK